MITIKEIAKIAGVSRGTVDRALNERGGIKPELKNRILEIAKEYNYVPNKNAKKLKALEEEKVIGAIMSRKSKIYFERIISGIRKAQEETENSKLKIEIVSVDNFDSEAILDKLDYFKNKKVDGILTAVMHSEEIASKMDEIVDSGIPIITLVTDVKCKRLGFFGEDSILSGEIVARLFLKTMKDRMNFLIIIGNPKFTIFSDRLSSFEKYLKDKNADYNINEFIYSDEEYENSYKKIEKVLKKDREINAIFMSTGDGEALHDVVEKLKIKESISVVSSGYEDSFYRECLKEDYIDFAIDTHPEIIGYKAAKAIYDYIVFKEFPENEKNYIDSSIKIL